MSDKNREEFEVWLRPVPADRAWIKMSGEKYSDRETEHMWQAWQAAREQPERPSHEEIIMEGANLVCTACGTTTVQPERVELSDDRLDAIMTMVQEFASAWALVGGRFDDGSMLEAAYAQRTAIRASLSAQSVVSDTDVGDMPENGAGIGLAHKYASALNQLRDWFVAQRNAISKGCGSTWDMLQCDEQIDLIETALSTKKELQ